MEPRVNESRGASQSDQAEASTLNPLAASTQMRILIELQVISQLLHQGQGHADDLANMRASISASIT